MNGSATTCVPRRPPQIFSLFRPLALILVLSALLGVIAPAAAQGRIVAVGDIHGDYDSFVALLQRAGLIDSSRRWIGGDATLVQTGDFLDRGPKSRQVMDLLMELEEQAPAQNGQVIVLLGNHEIMNLTGDLRYVSREEFAAFADRRSEERRKAAYTTTARILRERARAWKQPAPALTPAARRSWMEQHPAGFLEHRDAFGPRGKYGKWLRKHPVVARVGSGIFLHGGLSPAIASKKIVEINARVKREIEAFDAHRDYLVRQKLAQPFFTLRELAFAAQTAANELKKERSGNAGAQANTNGDAGGAATDPLALYESFLAFPKWLCFHPEGPVWFRGLARWPEQEGTARVARLTESFHAAYIVVGHTSPGRNGMIHHRFGGRVFLIDTGMLSSHYKGGQPTALEIADGKFTAIYPEERVTLIERDPSVATDDAESPATDPAGSGEQRPGSLVPPALLFPPASKKPTAGVWRDPKGTPLPFASEREILDFLREADVARTEELKTGTTRPLKVLLDKGGNRMNAIFRDVDEFQQVARLADGRTEHNFRDSYRFEVAAYELSKLLGLDNVPPVVLRDVRGRQGSLQAWVENSMRRLDQLRAKIPAPDPAHWNRQLQTLYIFDQLIYNTDRNQGNILIDSDWKVWMIDHTRAFRQHSRLQDESSVAACERGLWEKLQALDEKTVRERLGKFLSEGAIKAIFARRDELVERIRRLILERGEENVLYVLE